MKSTRSKSPDATLGGIRCGRTLSIFVLVLGLVVWAVEPGKARPASTAFTYQGRLIDANDVADGLYDFQFKLYDDANTVTGNQVGSDLNTSNVDVIDGYFTVVLDFNEPNAFNGEARWLEIDLNDDCRVDLRDLAILGENWLQCNLDPPEACWE